jgi:glyoxylase-like metal-dependent hydrolase (beta-lactamase superfamily II)
MAFLALAYAAHAQTDPNVQSDDDRAVQAGRAMLAREHPEVLAHMARNDGFGGPRSRRIANAMLSRDPALVAEARSAMSIEVQGPGIWLIRFPYVNVVLVETGDSLVLIDTGYASIGPVLRDVIPTLSRRPLRTIVLTHSHVDHAYGAFALVDRAPRPDVIASEMLPRVFDMEIRLRGSISRYNNQPVSLQPTDRNGVVLPNITFRDRMTRRIGGERFEFFHAPGETEDQIYVWLPGRRTLVTADYYQGFLPNAGNGRRIQRHVEEWAAALRHMASLRPARVLPLHGQAIDGEAAAAEALTLHADALQFIADQVVERLNRGERKDRIFANIEWPERFANSPLLRQSYVRPDDIARMVAHRWTGWWDDLPSHYASLAFEEEAREAIALAGGVERIDERARALLATNPRLSARLADWAQYGAPDDPRAQRLAADVYLARIMAPDTPIQESVVYLDAAARARARLEVLTTRQRAR